jgi:hypothetical protein
MPKITFAVYERPSAELPYLAVVLSDREVIAAEPVQSADEGEQLIQQAAEELAKEAGSGRRPDPADVVGRVVRGRSTKYP